MDRASLEACVSLFVCVQETDEMNSLSQCLAEVALWDRVAMLTHPGKCMAQVIK